MGKSGQNETKTTKKLSEKWAYGIGLVIVFGSEFILRDVLLPEQANDIHIGEELT